MQIKFFTIPITSVNEYNDEVNQFLRSHKTIEMEKRLVETQGGAYWCLLITYVTSLLHQPQQKEKTDYIKILEPEIFSRFSRMREIRKKIAAEEGVSAYVIFTDAELAEIAKLEDLTITNIRGIKGIGEKKAMRFGEKLIMIFNADKDEKSRSADE